MNKKTVIALWAVVIIVYIINIIMIGVAGTTSIFNNIMAWVVSTILAFYIINLQCTLINKQKYINEINKFLLDTINESNKKLK